MEEEIVEIIKKEIIALKEISHDDRNFKLYLYVNYILENLLKLISITNDDNLKQNYLSIWKNLDYANIHEVKSASNAYNKARKKNAPYKREIEYKLSLKMQSDRF